MRIQDLREDVWFPPNLPWWYYIPPAGGLAPFGQNWYPGQWWDFEEPPEGYRKYFRPYSTTPPSSPPNGGWDGYQQGWPDGWYHEGDGMWVYYRDGQPVGSPVSMPDPDDPNGINHDWNPNDSGHPAPVDGGGGQGGGNGGDGNTPGGGGNNGNTPNIFPDDFEPDPDLLRKPGTGEFFNTPKFRIP